MEEESENANSDRQQKRQVIKQKPTIQGEFDTLKMDQFTENLYKVSKQDVLKFLKTYLFENGQSLLNLRDSTGNSLIHHICTIFIDSQDENSQLIEQFKETLSYLLSQQESSQNANQDEECMNFLRGLPLSIGQQKEALQNVGIQYNEISKVSHLLKINIGNSFGQTPLHLLAHSKKEKLLIAYIDIVFEKNKNLLDLDMTQTNKQSFLHILLQTGQIETFENIVKLYEGEIDLKKKDQFKNSVLMIYQRLKREQLSKLKLKKDYFGLRKAILSSTIQAIGDYRNLIFDKQLGTNILSELVKVGSELDFIALLDEMKDLSELGIFDLEVLTNLPANDGKNLAFNVFNILQFEGINDFIDRVKIETIKLDQESKNGENIVHMLFQNPHLSTKEKEQLAIQIIEINSNLLRKVDKSGNIPLNYLLDTLTEPLDQQSNIFIKNLLSQCDLNHFVDIGQIKDNMKIVKQQKNEKRPKFVKVSKFDKSEKQNFKNKLYRENQQPVAVSPLEIAVKKNLKGITKLLLEEYKVNGLVISQNLRNNLLEIAFQQQNIDIIGLIVQNLNEIPFDSKDILKFLSKIWKQNLFNIHYDLQTVDQQIFNKQYHALVLKTKDFISLDFFNEEKEKSLNTDQFNQDEKESSNFYENEDNKSASDNKASEQMISQNNDEEVKGIQSERQKSQIDEEKNNQSLDQGFINLSSVSKQDSKQEQKQEIKAKSKLIKFISKKIFQIKNWILLKALKDQIKNLEEEVLLQILRKASKHFASKLDSEGMHFLLEEFPQLKQQLQNDEEFLKQISNKTLNSKDIRDPSFYQVLSQKFDIWLPPFSQDIFQQKKGKKKDARFKRLSQTEQNILISSFKESLFKHQIELYQKGLYIDKSDNILPFKLTGKAKTAFIQKLIDHNVLFKVINIKIQSNQTLIFEALKYSLSRGDLKFSINLLTLLKDYLTEKCSNYPIDFFAEVLQFERNYPYRELKISRLIRLVNYKKDQFPILLGQNDTFDINDDQETQMSDLWEQLCRQVNDEPIKIQGSDDILVPNALALIQQILVSNNSIKVIASKEKLGDLEKIYQLIFELGGFPTIEIANLKDKSLDLDPTQVQFLNQRNQLMLSLQSSIRNKEFQTILHQMAVNLPSEQDKKALKELVKDTSLQSQSFNSRDKKGKTPIIIAIEHKNFSFLEVALDQGNKVFFQENQSTTASINRFFMISSVEEKVNLLELLSSYYKKLETPRLAQLNQINLNQMNALVDFQYDLKNDSGKEDDIHYQLFNAQQTFVMKEMKPQFIESYKILRNFLSELRDQSLTQQLLLSQQLTLTRQIGHTYHTLGCDISLEQLDALEKSCYKICNFVGPAFEQFQGLSSKNLPLTLNFPFTNYQYYYSYILKFVLLSQSKNEKLIDYVFERMDLNKWRPYLLEIMVYIGKIKGSKHHIFQKLFNKEKAYLMGKILTVEANRLKSIGESAAPQLAMQYYGEKPFINLLTALIDILVVNNEKEMFKQLFLDYSRFYIVKDVLQKAMESCIRNFQPRLAILIPDGPYDNHEFKDMANLMPNLSSIVTMKSIKETSSLAKGYKQYPKELFNEYLLHIINSNWLQGIISLTNKDPEYKKYREQFIINAFTKSSPEVCQKFLDSLLSICESPIEVKKILTIIFRSFSSLSFSITNVSFAKAHNNLKRQEMRTYLLGRVANFANDKDHYQLLMNEKKSQKLSDLLCIQESDLKELRNKIIDYKKDQQVIEEKEFVYEEIQQDSIQELQKYSSDEIKAMPLEELRSKSDNLLHLYEHLHKEDSKRRSTGQGANQSVTIQELRQLMNAPAQGASVNLFTLYGSNDSKNINNAVEDYIFIKKFKNFISRVNIDDFDLPMIKKFEAGDWKSRVDNEASGGLFYLCTTEFFIKFGVKKRDLMFGDYINRDFQNVDEENEEGREAVLSDIFSLLQKVQNHIQQILKLCSDKSSLIKKAAKLTRIYFDNIQIDKQLYATLTETHIQEQFGDFSANILMHPIIFKENHKYIYEKLLTNRELLTYIQEDAHLQKREAFSSLFLPLFFHGDLHQLQEIIDNQIIMSCLDPLHRCLLFLIIGSKKLPELSDKLNDHSHETKMDDQLLLKLLQYFDNTQNLNGLNDVHHIGIFRSYRRDYFPKLLSPQTKINMMIQGGVIQTVNDIVMFLIKTKRFNVVKEYINVFPLTIEYFYCILIHARKKDISIVDLALQQFFEEFKQNNRIFSWLYHNCQEDVFDFVNNFYIEMEKTQKGQSQVDNPLLAIEMNHLKTQGMQFNQVDRDEPLTEDELLLQQNNILIDFIVNKDVKGIRKIKDLCSEEQWENLLKQRQVWSRVFQSNENDEDSEQREDEEVKAGEQKKIEKQKEELVYPFFYALKSYNFEICRFLLPFKEVDDSSKLGGKSKIPNDLEDLKLKQKESDLLKQFLLEDELITLNIKDQEIIERLRCFDLIFKSEANKQAKNRSKNFTLTKKLMLFPELLLFVLLGSNDDLYMAVNNQAKNEGGIYTEIDIFLFQCGFELNNDETLMKYSSRNEAILLIIEKGLEIYTYLYYQKDIQEVNKKYEDKGEERKYLLNKFEEFKDYKSNYNKYLKFTLQEGDHHHQNQDKNKGFKSNIEDDDLDHFNLIESYQQNLNLTMNYDRNSQVKCRPYSFMSKIHKNKLATHTKLLFSPDFYHMQLMFQFNENDQVYQALRNKIEVNHHGVLRNLFQNNIQKLITQALGYNFYLTYYLLQFDKLDLQLTSELASAYFFINRFDTIAHDFIILDALRKRMSNDHIFDMFNLYVNYQDKDFQMSPSNGYEKSHLFYTSKSNELDEVQIVPIKFDDRSVALLLYLLTNIPKTSDNFKLLNKDKENQKSITYKQILKQFLVFAHLEAYSKKNEVYFDSIVQSFELFLKGHSLYHEYLIDFEQYLELQKNLRIEDFQIQQIEESIKFNKINKNQVNKFQTDEIFQSLRDLITLDENAHFRALFKFKLQILNFQDEYVPSLIVNEIRNLTQELQGTLNQDTYIDLIIDKQLQKVEIKGDQKNLYISVSDQHIKDLSSIEHIKNQVQHQLDKTMLSCFMQDSVTEFLKLISKQEERDKKKLNVDCDWIEELSEDQIKMIADYLKKIQIYQKSNYTLKDLVIERIMKYRKDDIYNLRTSLEYTETITLKYLPLQDLLTDKFANIDNQLKKASNKYKSDTAIIFSFDFAQPKLVLYESAIPFIFQEKISRLEKEILLEYKFHELRSKYHEVPPLKIDFQSFIETVKSQNISQQSKYQDIEELLTDFFTHHSLMKYLYSIAVENMADHYRKLNSKEIQQVEHKREKYGTYSALQDITLKFKVDELNDDKIDLNHFVRKSNQSIIAKEDDKVEEIHSIEQSILVTDCSYSIEKTEQAEVQNKKNYPADTDILNHKGYITFYLKFNPFI